MYYTFGCDMENRALDEKWKCHYKDTCVICRLNKACRKLSCIDGSCPIADYKEHPQKYDYKPTCNGCGLYKGCEDCYFMRDNHCSVNEMLEKEKR